MAGFWRTRNVSIRDGVAIAGLTGSTLGVTGVRLDDGEILAANLVVDATGRGSRSDRWLANLDFPVPETAEVKIGVGYATRVFRREPGFLPDGRLRFHPAHPAGGEAGRPHRAHRGRSVAGVPVRVARPVPHETRPSSSGSPRSCPTRPSPTCSATASP